MSKYVSRPPFEITHRAAFKFSFLVIITIEELSSTNLWTYDIRRNIYWNNKSTTSFSRNVLTLYTNRLVKLKLPCSIQCFDVLVFIIKNICSLIIRLAVTFKLNFSKKWRDQSSFLRFKNPCLLDKKRKKKLTLLS